MTFSDMPIPSASSSRNVLPDGHLISGASLSPITGGLSNGLSPTASIQPGAMPLHVASFNESLDAWTIQNPSSPWMDHGSVLQGQGTLRGTGRRDRLVGTGKQDKIKGRGGNDVLIGKGRGDRLVGGNGNDRLKGNGGGDRLLGGKGSDRLLGGSGHDRLQGGKGKDKYIGGGGKDTIVVGRGDGSMTLRKTNIVKKFQAKKDAIELDGIEAGAIAITQGSGRRSSDTLIQHRETGEYLLVLKNTSATVIASDDLISPAPIITEPDIEVTPGTAVSFVNSGVNFKGTDTSKASDVQALGGSSITVGSKSYYIGYEQVSSSNQNPILVSYDSQSPSNSWVRRDYEVTGADSRGYGLFWSGTNLYATFSIDGTQGTPSEDFRRASGDAVQSWLEGYGSGGGAKISIVARLDPNTGELLDAAYLSARLSNGNSNSLTIENISVNASGNLIIQAKSWFSPRNPDGSRMEQIGSGSSPFDYTVEITSDLTQVLNTAAVGWRP